MQEELNNEEINFSYYIEILLKHCWVIICFIALGAFCAVMLNTFMRPAYKATALMMINQENAGKIDTNPYTSFTAEEDYYRTQYQLLESRNLLQKVYNQMNLGQYEEFENPSGLKKLTKAIDVSPIARSRLVNLSVTSYDPALATEIVNNIAQTFVAENISNRISMGQDVIKALESTQRSKGEQELLNSMPQVVNSDFIKSLKLQETELLNKQAELSSKYTAVHPEVISVKRQLSAVQNKIALETQRLVQSIKIELSGQFSGNNIRIVDNAVVPEKPIRPRKLLNLAIGLCVGALFGVLFAFIMEFFDQTVKNSEDLENKLKLPFLGFVPKEKLKKNEAEYAFMLKKGNFLLAENVRNIRTMLAFAKAQEPNAPILITSALQGEGKSNLSTNLAVALAQAGSKVLIVDGDLRRSRLHRAFRLSPELGLSNIWTSEGEKAAYAANIQPVKDVPNLFVMTAGQRPPNPAELLNTPKLADFIDWAKKNYDQVIIDCPAIVPVSDTLLWGKYIPLAVFVVRCGQTNVRIAQIGIDKLNKAGIKILGAVIGHYKTEGLAYGKYGYYKKSYGYYEDK
ncbi:GumC family protein [Candidatus Proelusimicrobium excrementi]|uniref:GumC family protein n=1 Tax=Candidatus Proelusimicrobium excrementi TaxID=3416222 RepID=UPI003CA90D49|nr:polysaccharide biosynthesis tyrosine autokinase [Elusimicrobiaceae bacterium]